MEAGMTEQTEHAEVVHVRDKSVPVEFIRHVGPVARCVCGRDYAGGYECEGAKEDRARAAARGVEGGAR
jgi:hypothetical protein